MAVAEVEVEVEVSEEDGVGSDASYVSSELIDSIIAGGAEAPAALRLVEGAAIAYMEHAAAGGSGSGSAVGKRQASRPPSPFASGDMVRQWRFSRLVGSR